MEKNEKLYTPKQLGQLLNVSDETLRYWNVTGRIKAIKTKGGHRRYLYDEEQLRIDKDEGKKKYLYARVSSSKQVNDLERQVAFLQKAHPGYEVVKDIGSGINFKRPGLLKILGECFEGRVCEVVVAHRDRLSRFGFDLFEFLFKKSGVHLKVLDNEGVQEPFGELAKDLFAIVTVFTARYYGTRKYHLRKKNKNLPKPRATKTLLKMPRRYKVLLQSHSELYQKKVEEKQGKPKRALELSKDS